MAIFMDWLCKNRVYSSYVIQNFTCKVTAGTSFIFLIFHSNIYSGFIFFWRKCELCSIQNEIHLLVINSLIWSAKCTSYNQDSHTWPWTEISGISVLSFLETKPTAVRKKDEHKNCVFTCSSSASRVNNFFFYQGYFSTSIMLLALCKNIKSNFVSSDVIWKLSEIRLSKAIFNITRFVNKMKSG